MTAKARFNCQYVQPDMVYAGSDCTPAFAIEQLHAIMGEEMTRKLLVQAAGDDAGPAFPAYILSCEWPHGAAALNLFCEADGWFYIWDIQVRRVKWLPFMKGYATGMAPARADELARDIEWLSTAALEDVPQYFHGR